MNYLEKHALYLIKEKLNQGHDIEFKIKVSVTLPCKCCSETKYFYGYTDDLLNKSDRELLKMFEEQCEFYFDSVKHYYLEHNTLEIEL